MKKILLFSGASLIIGMSVTAQTAVRNGLVEEFSSSTCPPCVSFNNKYHPAVEAVEANMPESHINVISYQMNWPNNPPLDYSYNSDGLARRTYYNTNSVPSHFVNGTKGAANTSALTTQVLIDELNSTKNGTADFEISGSYVVTPTNATSGSFKIDVNVMPLKSMTTAYTVHVAATEHYYRNDSASVPLYDYYNVMRKMFPSGNGKTEASWTANTAKTYSYTHNYVIKSPFPTHPAHGSFEYWGNPFNGDVIVWVEDPATKTVLQSQVIRASWPTSVATVDKINNVLIYPNPASDYIHAGFTLDKSSTVQLQVVDMMGRVVYEMKDQKFNAGAVQFNVKTDTFAPGLYTLILSNEAGSHAEQFSVAK